MKKFLLVACLTGCAAVQHGVTKKCPTTPALVGDAVLMGVPLYLSANAWVDGNYPYMAFDIAMAAAVAASAALATETCK